MTDTQHPTPPPSNTWVGAVISAVIVLAGISSVTYLTIVGRDPAQVIALLTLIGAPAVASVANVFLTQRTAKNVEVVKDNTNGALSALTARLEALENNGGPNQYTGQHRRDVVADRLAGQQGIAGQPSGPRFYNGPDVVHPGNGDDFPGRVA